MHWFSRHRAMLGLLIILGAAEMAKATVPVVSGRFTGGWQHPRIVPFVEWYENGQIKSEQELADLIENYWSRVTDTMVVVTSLTNPPRYPGNLSNPDSVVQFYDDLRVALDARGLEDFEIIPGLADSAVVPWTACEMDVLSQWTNTDDGISNVVDAQCAMTGMDVCALVNESVLWCYHDPNDENYRDDICPQPCSVDPNALDVCFQTLDPNVEIWWYPVYTDSVGSVFHEHLWAQHPQVRFTDTSMSSHTWSWPGAQANRDDLALLVNDIYTDTLPFTYWYRHEDTDGKVRIYDWRRAEARYLFAQANDSLQDNDPNNDEMYDTILLYQAGSGDELADWSARIVDNILKMPGDTNCDGEVNTLDWYNFNAALEWGYTHEMWDRAYDCTWASCDLDGDGDVDSDDARLLRQAIEDGVQWGACFYDDNDTPTCCQDTSESECVALGGEWSRGGQCRGACTYLNELDTRVCVNNKYFVECEALGGFFHFGRVCGDCDDNGQDDLCEMAAVLDPDNTNAPNALDCDGNGVLDVCDPDYNDNDIADACDIAAGVLKDCNGNGVGDVYEIPTDGSVAGWGLNTSGQCNVPAPGTGLRYTQVSACASHSLALRSDGAVIACGDSSYGMNTVPSLDPNDTYTFVSAAYQHNLALTQDGYLVAWGRNDKDQLRCPVIDSFIAVAGGCYHSIALKPDGSLVTWGTNYDPNDPNGPASLPTGVTNTNYAAISSGYYFNLALKDDGTIIAWGSDKGPSGSTAGQCTDVPACDPQRPFVAIAAGAYHGLALRSDGTIAAWGLNISGQCDIPEPNRRFIAIAAGRAHSVGLRDDGTLVAWGAGECGETGDGHYGQSCVPMPNSGFVGIAAGNHTLALMPVGGACCINDCCMISFQSKCVVEGGVYGGDGTTCDSACVATFCGADCNSNGVTDSCDIANETSTDYNENDVPDECEPDCNGNSVPDDYDIETMTSDDCNGNGIPDECETDCDDNDVPDECDIATDPSLDCDGNGLLDECEIAADADLDCNSNDVLDACEVGVPGTILSWGDSTAAQYTPPPLNMGAHYTAISSLAGYSIALRSDGGLAVWGAHEGNTATLVPAMQVGNPCVAVAAGYGYCLALRQDGTLEAWGRDDKGQTSVPTLDPNRSIVDIAAGAYHGAALLDDGSIVAWGSDEDNWSHQTNQTQVPTPNSSFTAVVNGYYHSLALRQDGSIVAWGSNYRVYTLTNQAVVPDPNEHDFVAVAAGAYHSLALKSDGSIVTWGWNGYGQCNVPTPNSGFVAIAAGEYHSVGLKADGSVVAWGRAQQAAIPSTNRGVIAISAGQYVTLGLLPPASGACNIGNCCMTSFQNKCVAEGGQYLGDDTSCN